MTIHTCKRCLYSSQHRQDVLRHLQKKSACTAISIDTDIARDLLIKEINTHIKHISHTCAHCNTCFSSKFNLNRHATGCVNKTINTYESHEVHLNQHLRTCHDELEALEANGVATSASSSPNTTNVTTSEMTAIPYNVEVLDTDLVVSPPLELYDITNAADAFTVDGKRVRKTNETPPRVSVIDLISVIDDIDNKQASKIVGRLKDQYPDVSPMWGNLKFPGKGQKDTPVTDARGVVTIINLLSGRRAAQFRAASADVIVRYLGGDTSLIAEINRNADAQQHLPTNNIARLFGEDVEAGFKYTANESTLHIESGPLMGYDESGLYFIQYGERILYDHTGIPQNVLILGFGHAKNSGYERCKEHKQLTGPTTRVIDFMPTPHYEQCEKKLEKRLKGINRIVKGKIMGKTGEMREQFWITDRAEYDAILKQVKQDVHDLRVKYETSELVLVEQEKTKRVEAESAARTAEAESATRIAEIGVRNLELQLEIMKLTASHAK